MLRYDCLVTLDHPGTVSVGFRPADETAFRYVHSTVPGTAHLVIAVCAGTEQIFELTKANGEQPDLSNYHSLSLALGSCGGNPEIVEGTWHRAYPMGMLGGLP